MGYNYIKNDGLKSIGFRVYRSRVNPFKKHLSAVKKGKPKKGKLLND